MDEPIKQFQPSNFHFPSNAFAFFPQSISSPYAMFSLCKSCDPTLAYTNPWVTANRWRHTTLVRSLVFYLTFYLRSLRVTVFLNVTVFMFPRLPTVYPCAPRKFPFAIPLVCPYCFASCVCQHSLKRFLCVSSLPLPPPPPLVDERVLVHTKHKGLYSTISERSGFTTWLTARLHVLSDNRFRPVTRLRNATLRKGHDVSHYTLRIIVLFQCTS